MSEIKILRGLIASGKTTYAKSLGYKRVNKDDLRSMLDDGKWSKSNEKFVNKVRNAIIREAMQENLNIVVDDTNFEEKHIDTISDMVIQHNEINPNKYDLEIELIEASLEECLKRDAKRSKPVGKGIILDMYNRYLKPKSVERNTKLEDCLIVDIDGTLSEKGDRDIYDASKAHLDTVIEPVAEIIRKFDGIANIIFLSGRTEAHRGVTEKWLAVHGLWGGRLYMRKDGDKRCDSIVKKELYEENVKDKYNVLFVIDDRLRVCRMWVDQGLFVLNVNQLNIEF